MPNLTNPTAGDVHVNAPLTNFSQKYLQDEASFVASRAFPNAPVSKQSDLYYTFDRDDFFRDDAEERADGTESAGGGFDLSTDPYFARVYAYHKDVTDRQRANQDSAVQLDQSATEYVTHKLMMRREKVMVANLFTAGLWANDQNVNWLAAGTSPIIDIRAGKTIVHGNTGRRPNKMLIGRSGFDTLMDNDDILDRINGGATTQMPALVQRMRLAELLELDEIFVLDAVETTSVKGAAATTRAFVGGDNALLYFAPNAAGLNTPTAAVQFSWTGLMGATTNGMRIKRFREERLEADRVEGQGAFDYKLTGADLGHFFTSVSAA